MTLAFIFPTPSLRIKADNGEKANLRVEDAVLHVGMGPFRNLRYEKCGHLIEKVFKAIVVAFQFIQTGIHIWQDTNPASLFGLLEVDGRGNMLTNLSEIVRGNSIDDLRRNLTLSKRSQMKVAHTFVVISRFSAP